MEKIEQYLLDNKIIFKKISDGIFNIDNKLYCLIEPKEYNKRLSYFDDKFNLLQSDLGYDYHIIDFGGRYYYINPTDQDFELVELKYIGKSSDEIETNAYLGVHGGFEILNGSRSYQDWCKKAKFMGVKNLALVERNTLAGILKFQLECIKNKIKPIIGGQFTIRRGYDLKYDIKLYVKDWRGWISLLNLNYRINTNNDFIPENFFFKNTKGLFVVIDPKSLKFDDLFPIDLDNDIYYQLDTVEFKDNEYDNKYLENLKKFIDSDYKPISIRDSYYLDKDDSEVKLILNRIRGRIDYISNNQYFKSNEDYFIELSELFKDTDNRLISIYNEAIKNEEYVANNCNFNINTKDRHLPNYELTKKEKDIYKNKENMFWTLIQEGLIDKYPNYTDIELDRIEEEFNTIELGDFIDYFLITRDIIISAQKNDILVGIGRGSAGGSLISNILDIIKIDPLSYGLLFSRFLNKGRIGEQIDCDVIKIQTDNNKEIQLYPEDEITIFVDGEVEIIQAKNLKEGDNIREL